MREKSPLNNPRIALARKKAREILSSSGNKEPPTKLLKVIEYVKKDNLLSVRGLDMDKLDGANIRVGDTTEIIYNKNKHIHRNRFTVSHEIGHLVLGHTSKSYAFADFESSYPEEKEANEFAGELLMPLKLIKKLFKEGKSPQQLAGDFLVSEDAMFTKLIISKLI